MANQERSRTSSTASTETKIGTGTKPGGAARTAKTAAKTATAAPPTGASTVPPRRSERRAEMIQKRREERLTQYERRRKEWLYTRIGLGAIAALVLLGLGWGAYTVYDNWRDEQDLEGVADFEYAGGQHSANVGDTINYENEIPPAGGQHDPAWQNCGFYAEPIRSEHAVHSLEHGAVWITYRPDLPADDIEELENKAEGEAYLLVSPFPDLQAPVVVQSWNHQLVLDGVDDDRLDTFIRVYLQGDDVPEPGASCTGNVSTTA